MRNLIFVFFLAFSYSAFAYPSPNSKAESVIGKGLGKFRFELRSLGGTPYERDKSIAAEVLVYLPSGALLQTIPLDVEIPGPGFDFIDLNDDGYVDLLVYNACAGFAMCAGSTIAADVFLYAPKLGRFVKSKTLSGRGDISKSKAKGCVIANYKSGLAGYTDEEWCFNIKTGRWRMKGSSGGEPEKE